MLKKYKHLIALALLLIVSFFTYRHFSNSSLPAHHDVKVVDAQKISLGSINKSINLIGTIKATNSSQLVAQEYGTFEIIIQSGSKVKAGDLIAKIINKDVSERYKLSVSAESIAKAQFDRSTRLFKSGAYSKNELEKSKNALISTSKDLSDAKIALARLEFRAAFDGVVGAYKAQSGAQIQVNSQVVTIYDPSNIRVEFDVPSSAIAYVNDGQSVTINAKEYKLTHIQKILDEEKHMSPAFCNISCADCIIGSNIDVSLTLIHKPQVIVIPFEAVFLRNGKSSVYIIKDEKAELRHIELGIREKNIVEVIKGLEAGEELVCQNPARLYPGVSIKIQEANSSSK